MTIPAKVLNFLNGSKVKFEELSHRQVFTAYDKAATLRIKPNIVGKTLILKADNDLVLALIPGNKNLDKNNFKKVINNLRKTKNLKGVKNIDFISEKLMKSRFKGIKIGAVPAFGNLYKLQTFIEKSLLKEPKLILNSGDYKSSIEIKGSNLKKIIPDLTAGSFSKSKK